jgi:hypothetical protein
VSVSKPSVKLVASQYAALVRLGVVAELEGRCLEVVAGGGRLFGTEDVAACRSC